MRAPSATAFRKTLLASALGILLLLSFNPALLSSQEASSGRGSLARAPRTESEQQVIDSYKRVNRAVVNVTTKVAERDFFGVSVQEGSGSGVVIDKDQGLVITNFHVIEGADRAAVTLADGSTHGVKVIGQDPDNDLALLQIKDPPADLVAAEFGDSSTLEVGQRVLAIGNPFGLQRTLTTGIVSSLGRTIQSKNGRMIEDIIQTDAAINPGNSGGPLLDLAGRIVGLNTAILSRSGESSGIGFAIPVNQVKRAVPLLRRYGRVPRPKIGVVLVDTDAGPAFLYVQPGSPAARAGLTGARQVAQQGIMVESYVDFSVADFVVAVNGVEVRSKVQVLEEIGKTKEGESLDLTVRRGLSRSRSRSVKVTPELG